jgi:hypothetical protein
METWAEAEGTKQSKAIASAVNPNTLSLNMIPPEDLSGGAGAGLYEKTVVSDG